jgi:hypothetical protein
MNSFKSRINPILHNYEPLLTLLTSNIALEVFVCREWKGINIAPVHIKFSKDLPPYFRCKTRPIAQEIMEPVKKAVFDYWDGGYLDRSDEGAYGYGMVGVIKPDGTARVCGDYRPANKHAIGIPLMMPDVITELEKMLPYKYFTELDWSTAFHQIPIDQISSERLAITTPWGLFRPKFVPEGIVAGSALLMTHAQKFFMEFDTWCLALHDNLLIGATDEMDMTEKMAKVLLRCHEANIQLKISKSKIAQESLSFFGYRITAGSYYSEEYRLQGILDLPFPKCLKDVQAFFGMMNYVSPFIPHYSTLMAPISAMNSKDFSYNKDKWRGIDYISKWEEAKRAVCHATTLYLPDRTLTWTVKTDASKYGIGAVLTQAMPASRLSAAERATAIANKLVYTLAILGIPTEVVDVPIAFMSKKFTEPATRWVVTRQELYAIVACYVKWERLLILKPHILCTDHNDIVTLNAQKTTADAMTMRWRNWLAKFPFVIKHIPGKINIIADYLSRCYIPTMPTHSEVKTANLTATTVMADNLTATDMLNRVHRDTPGGHVGAKTTWHNLHKTFPGVTVSLQAVSDYIHACTICQKMRNHKHQAHTRIKTLPIGNARSTTHVDTLKLEKDINGNEYAFVFINAFTKYTLIVPSTDKSAKSF